MTEPLLIPAENPAPLTGDGNNTWLLDGARPALIDAGVGRPEHLDAIARALGGRPLDLIIVTHGHPDHASGVPALVARWPGVTVIAHDTVSAAPVVLGQNVPVDGELRAGDDVLQLIHTPGHASDHICAWSAAARHLFCGDMLVAEGTVMIPPRSRGGGLGDYLDSLTRLAALDPARAFPGHGPIIERPTESIASVIAHRLEREAQVRACLDAGLTHPKGIVGRIYPDLPADLHDVATLTVEAHLEKLRDDADDQTSLR